MSAGGILTRYLAHPDVARRMHIVPDATPFDKASLPGAPRSSASPSPVRAFA